MSATALRPLLAEGHRRARLAAPFLGALSLAAARVHEFCGPARRTLALLAARAIPGPVVWIRAGWLPERLHPEGVLAFIEPGRLVFVTAARPEDLLWCTEEALRAGAAPLVVADLPEPPRLTPVRRLQLAAETGAAAAIGLRLAPPLGLLLTPGDGGAQGAETRWRLVPRHDPGHRRWRLSLLRARATPPAEWDLSSHSGGFVLAPARPVTET
ncbi:MAG: hypothetical protein N2422_08875 [Rhodobacteraceae bacterium]|nr:hypothetical protein [Paracoccaceae bacterium]